MLLMGIFSSKQFKLKPYWKAEWSSAVEMNKFNVAIHCKKAASSFVRLDRNFDLLS